MGTRLGVQPRAKQNEVCPSGVGKARTTIQKLREKSTGKARITPVTQKPVHMRSVRAGARFEPSKSL